MSLAVDSSSPARVTGATTNGTVVVTTAAFDPPASVVVATVQANVRPNGATATISNNGAALTWTAVAERSAADSGGLSGFAGIYVATLGAGRTGMTVTATLASVGGTSSEINTPTIKVYAVTGAAASPVGGSAEGSSTTNNLTTAAFTTVGASSLLFAAGCDWNALGSPTSTDLTLSAFTTANISGASGHKTLGSTGSSATTNLDAGGAAAAAWDWVTAEILAAASSVSGAVAATLPVPTAGFAGTTAASGALAAALPAVTADFAGTASSTGALVATLPAPVAVLRAAAPVKVLHASPPTAGGTLRAGQPRSAGLRAGTPL